MDPRAAHGVLRTAVGISDGARLAMPGGLGAATGRSAYAFAHARSVSVTASHHSSAWRRLMSLSAASAAMARVSPTG